ncbi:hypothetical protein B0T19DRAFT_262526 [Cercophora scortea]|uniref:Clr5 domain-containing protein n=1 Tax=Cercophora scortea TaxID=314031 RepID=A0AAE0M7X9_9PEZI|nr:hypothetical protein B0T19DRAFT_262526 [Cercophora scortea]
MTLIIETDSLDNGSKRMYDKRFREWNVFKNVNSDEKDRLIRRIHEAAPTSQSQKDKDNMSQEDLRRTLRWAKTIPQGMRRISSASSASSSSITTATSQSTAMTTVQPQHQQYHQQQQQQQHQQHQHHYTSRGKGGLSISDLVVIKERPNTSATYPPSSTDGLSPPDMSSSSDVACATPASSTGWSEDPPTQNDSVQELDTRRSVSGSPVPCLNVFRAQIKAISETPPPPMVLDSRSRTIEMITICIRDYLDWQLENIPEGVLPDDYLGHRTSEESTQYWSAVKNALYLIKVSAGTMGDITAERAYPTLADAGTMAGSAMVAQPFDFLRNVFATLSPANTSAKPELRAVILQFLASEARKRHSSNHPIARICQELQADDGCQEVSRRALQCMLDIFNRRLGRSRAVTFKLLDSLATLLRRNGEFDAAMEIVLELLVSCRQVFGPESDQARTIENEIAHFYMVADEYELALGHCMAVVRRPQPAGMPLPETEPVFYQDGIAAHTMEDIAEIHQRRGDVEQSITWLERAANIALNVWGPKDIATAHIIDKVTSLQRQFGKDLLRSAMYWESAIVQR